MQKAMKIPDAKAAVEKEWDKLETIQAWKLDKVKSKNEVILEAQRNKSKVHIASLMDLCHFKTRHENQNSDAQRSSRTSWRYCER